MVNQKHIQRADRNGNEVTQKLDNSLRGNAMRRAMQQQVPRTLTPYEWEQWYKEHGIPDAHGQTGAPTQGRWHSFCQWLWRIEK